MNDAIALVLINKTMTLVDLSKKYKENVDKIMEPINIYMGKLQKAESGTKYEAIEVENKVYLVSTSGKIVKSGTVKDANGTKFKTNSNGQITQVDEVSDDGKDDARDPVEPVEWDD